MTAIYRYPVKGLSAEKMNRVALIPGECLPHDRRFAIALGSTHFDPQCPEWLSKTNFIMLMHDEKLAQLRTHFDPGSGSLAIAESGRVLLSARMTEPEGCRLIADFFANFLGDAVNGPLRVVAAPGHPDPYRGAVRGVVRVRGAAEAAIVGQPEMPRRRAVGAQLVRAGHRARTAQRGVITERE